MNLFLQQVQQAGVVGAGGAGFPTYMKLDCDVDTVIINGAECEPLLNKDQVLMQNDSAALIGGIKQVMAHVGASQAIIGIKKKNAHTIDCVKACLTAGISILEMDDIYPAGDEVELVYRATGKRIAAGGLPKDIGIVVLNVESIINIYHCSQNMPVTETMVTVHGEVSAPYTASLPIGMSYADALALAGQITCDDYIIIEGGPMMGSVTRDLSKPIVKTSSGLLVLKADSRIAQIKLKSDQQVLKAARSACDQCGQCSAMCPRGLLGYPIHPQKVMRTLQAQEQDSYALAAQACCGCNLCTMWSCPEGIDVQRVCSITKRSLSSNNMMQSPAQLQATSTDVHPLKAYRGVSTKRLMQRLEVTNYAQRYAQYRPLTETIRRVSIPLSQHIGRPAEPIVQVGQQVSKGQMIAKPFEQSLSVAMHASIAGKVTSIANEIVIENR